jgi:hypothetical protein
MAIDGQNRTGRVESFAFLIETKDKGTGKNNEINVESYRIKSN